MTTTALYDDLAAALEQVAAHVGPAEGHGMLTGRLVGPGAAEPAPWIADVLADTEPRGEPARACLEALTRLYDETTAALASDQGLAFQPLLPGDEHPLDVRAAALGAWCQGFLYGLGRSEPGGDAALPVDAREALADLGEIARVDAETAAGEGAEGDYAELVEYVRVAALLIREHLHHPPRSEEGAHGSL